MLCQADYVAFLSQLFQRVLYGLVLPPTYSINAAQLAELPNGDGVQVEVLVIWLNLAAQIQYNFLLRQTQFETAALYKVIRLDNIAVLYGKILFVVFVHWLRPLSFLDSIL